MDYITNPHRYNGRVAITITLFAAILTIGCNAVKRVMKDPAKLDQVGRAWELKNPCISDTVTKLLPGTTDTSIVTHYDTTYLEKSDTVYITRTNTKRIHTRDTLVRTVEDTRRLNLARQDHSRDTALLRADIVRLNTELANMTDRRDTWQNRALSTWLILALIIAGFLFARKYKA